MIAEILYHKHITDWELDKLLNNEQFTSYVEPDYPLIIPLIRDLKVKPNAKLIFLLIKNVGQNQVI